MEPISILLIGLSIGAGGALSYNLYHAKNALQGVTDRTLVLSESQGAHAKQTTDALVALQRKIDQYDALISALRATQPEVDHGIRAHQAIALLEQGDVSPTTTQDAIDAVCSSISLQNVDVELSPMQSEMASRLFAVLDQQGQTLATLNLDGQRALQVGLCSLYLQNLPWAENAFGSAHQHLPGNDVVLKGLESVAILKADDVLRLHWLEAQLRLDPDNPELLRTHAHILVQQGDENAEKDVRRLEALGLDTPADRSLLAGLRHRAGSSNEAIDAIEQALAEDNKKPDYWLQYAQLLHEADEGERALEAVDSCLNLDRQVGDAWALRAKLLSTKSGREKEALKAATHAVALDCGGAELIVLKADLLTETGDVMQAETSLEKAIEKYPMDAELRSIVATRRISEGRIEVAQALLDNTPATIDHPELHIVEGRLHLARADRLRDGTGETDQILLGSAIKSFEAALELNRELGVAWLGLARTQRLMRNLDEAGESLTRARRLLGETDSPCSIEAALLAIDNNDIHAATRYIDAAEIQGSGEAIAYVRGNIAAKSGDYARAVAMYTDTLKQNPKHIRARLNRISCYLGLNQALEAKEDADVLLSLAPDLKVAIFARGDALTRLAEWEAAKEDLLVVLEDAPHHYMALTKLAACYLALDRPERAEGPINEALRLAPDFAEAWHQRGLLYLAWEKIETALSDFEAAIRADGNHLQAREQAAAIHHNFDNLEQAMAGWRGVLALDPNHTVARRRLQQCEQLLSTT
ncbi:MAG: tetratricopeptide repeat protein [Candidatus Thermoplasmatota archaeon]|nr:tetratricopeptide repeat protein [Candidatus Thermoplasmatota archaeon]